MQENIIKVDFGRLGAAQVYGLYQYDKGQILDFGESIPDGAYGMLDTLNDIFYTGAFIKRTPVALMMGNPNAEPEEEEE